MLCCQIVQVKASRQRTVLFRAMEDVETRFKLALQYIGKGGLAAQHTGQSPPPDKVLLEYYACVLSAAPCCLCVHPSHSPSPCHVTQPRRLYKQANLGDCCEREPWKIQVVAYHKWCVPATICSSVRWLDACVFWLRSFRNAAACIQMCQWPSALGVTLAQARLELETRHE